MSSTQADREQALGHQPMRALLRRMAIPTTIGMATTAIYNVVDGIFVGQGVGTLGLGGLSVAFPVQMIVLSIALMVGIGSGSIVSRALGAGDRETAAATVGTGFTTLTILAISVSALGLVFIDPILRLFGATPDILPFAREYLAVILPGTLFIAVAIGSNAVVRAEGQATFSMLIVGSGALLNIVLDPIFIFGLDMGLRGAALATVLAQAVSFVIALRFYAGPHSGLNLKLHHLRPRLEILRQSLSLGVSAFVRQFGASIFVIFTNNALGLYAGDTGIAAFGVIFRILTLALMPLIGIAQGFQPIAGFNYGAGNYGRVVQSIREALRASVLVALIGFAIMFAFPGALFRIFTSDPALLATGTRALRIVVLVVPLVGIQITGAIMFLAIGKPLPALMLSMLRQIILLIPMVIVLPMVFGETGIWAAFPVADGLSVIITATVMFREVQRLRALPCGGNAPNPEGCVDEEVLVAKQSTHALGSPGVV